jgi:hypothetical protein
VGKPPEREGIQLAEGELGPGVPEIHGPPAQARCSAGSKAGQCCIGLLWPDAEGCCPKAIVGCGRELAYQLMTRPDHWFLNTPGNSSRVTRRQLMHIMRTSKLLSLEPDLIMNTFRSTDASLA